jgi:hypothetical protein
MVSTDRVQMLIDRAFRSRFERIRLIMRHPHRDPNQPQLSLAPIRRFDVLRVPLPRGCCRSV